MFGRSKSLDIQLDIHTLETMIAELAEFGNVILFNSTFEPGKWHCQITKVVGSSKFEIAHWAQSPLDAVSKVYQDLQKLKGNKP